MLHAEEGVGLHERGLGVLALDLALVAGEELGRDAVVGDGARHEVADDDGRVGGVQLEVR